MFPHPHQEELVPKPNKTVVFLMFKRIVYLPNNTQTMLYLLPPEVRGINLKTLQVGSDIEDVRT